MARPRTFRPEDIPIPPDAKPHESWPPMMLEMAAHIGPYDTLRLVDAFAGQEVYIPMDAGRSPFVEIVGSDKAAILSHVYGRERLPIPTGRNALLRARRQGVIAAIRAGRLTVVEGAAILRMARRHLSRLVNQTDEGTECQAAPLLVRPKDARQLEMFGEN
ncbi:hypothetical protein [Novosphingobium sp. EMRT-2]|uniref:hypothetical protein n=1 Tax=Novosphingobium sp. EMRT-2 TaxID=2571749 RepID=UPI0010BD6AEE|nr:hypothetical protein [Novosphingobium sp. EMRT-2]QCI93243.1 hypothetical protein FA702_06540 [Novosphingobium sp. EMRT-2]